MNLGKTTDPLEINQAFKEFYVSFYSSEQFSTLTDFNHFLSKIEVPSIGQSVVEELEKPVTTAELPAAAMSLQSSKSPGRGGYLSEFYFFF